MVKYVNYGHPRTGTHMYVITLFRTDRGSWLVEVLPCDTYGKAVSDAIAWDIFPSWFAAYSYLRKQYKIYYEYVNGRC